MRPPATKEAYIKLGYNVAVVVGPPENPGADDAVHTYSDYHRMDADDWKLERGVHIIPLKTAEGALKAHRENGGAAPCKRCFPESPAPAAASTRKG